MAKDLVQAQIQSGQLRQEDTQQALADTHANLLTLRARGETAVVLGPEPGNWRQSISQHVIQCLECGRAFKQLSIRHLREHAMDARSYRRKYGIPRRMPLAARATTARRRKTVQETRPWEKTPRYLASQAATAAAAKKKRPAAKKGRQTKASD